jgi:hypothetical protein
MYLRARWPWLTYLFFSTLVSLAAEGQAYEVESFSRSPLGLHIFVAVHVLFIARYRPVEVLESLTLVVLDAPVLAASTTYAFPGASAGARAECGSALRMSR